MARLTYKKYQNKVKDSEMFGKWYARLVFTETMDTNALCEHIAQHGSIYTPDVVKGVVEKFIQCIREQLLESKKVKLDGLGTFYLAMSTGGANTAKEFDINEQLKAIRLRFLGDKSKGSKYSGPAIRREARLAEAGKYNIPDGNGGGNG
jgi:predicted histone-like DNA-binding protein